MLITKKSLITGKVHTKEIDVDERALHDWQAGHGLIQDPMPNVSAADREFIMTGITQEEWDNEFAE